MWSPRNQEKGQKRDGDLVPCGGPQLGRAGIGTSTGLAKARYFKDAVPPLQGPLRLRGAQERDLYPTGGSRQLREGRVPTVWMGAQVPRDSHVSAPPSHPLKTAGHKPQACLPPRAAASATRGYNSLDSEVPIIPAPMQAGRRHGSFGLGPTAGAKGRFPEDTRNKAKKQQQRQRGLEVNREGRGSH